MYDSSATIWTAGYGHRTLAEFVSLITAFHIDIVVDIRSVPIPYKGAKFASDQLREALERRSIQFHRAGHQLGCSKKASSNTAHMALRKSLRGYAEHMSTPVFKQGIKQLINLAKHNRVILVSETKDYEFCHRKLIADYLLLTEGWNLFHILENHLVVEHTLTGYVRYEYDSIIYDGSGAQNLVVH